MTLIGPGLLLFLLIVLAVSSLRVLREYQRILSHRADRITCRTQAGSVVRKVYRCAPYFLSCGKHVPQELSYTDNNGFINHIFCLSSYSQTKIQLTDAIFTFQKYKKVSKQRLVFHLSSMASLLH